MNPKTFSIHQPVNYNVSRPCHTETYRCCKDGVEMELNGFHKIVVMDSSGKRRMEVYLIEGDKIRWQ